MKETNVQAGIMLALSKVGATIFRNNQGTGVLGQVVSQDGGTFIVKNGRRVKYGVCNPGGSDLIGWKTITVTPDMVGEKLAVFLAVEVKSDSGRASKDQANFINAVRDAGGFAGVARTDDEAVQICSPTLFQNTGGNRV